MTSVLWLRRDLRRRDLPALGAAADATEDDVHVLFVIDPVPWGIDWVATGSPYAVGPGRVTTKDGTPYRVFTPFAAGSRSSPT
jgi:deoxyribodipyrimidine photolyase